MDQDRLAFETAGSIDPEYAGKRRLRSDLSQHDEHIDRIDSRIRELDDCFFGARNRIAQARLEDRLTVPMNAKPAHHPTSSTSAKVLQLEHP
jgi:hypothetical protein